MRSLLIGAGAVVAVLALAALMLVAVVVSGARREDQEKIAELHPFYDPPQPLPAGRPGDMVRVKPVAAPDGIRIWRVLYHSTAMSGQDIAVSGLIAAPDRTAPAGGFPLVAVAHGTDGMARTCAPSLNPFASRSPLPAALSPAKDRTSFFEQMVEPFTAAGFAVAATDYQGLGTPGVNPYLAGEDAARNVLDAARLMQRFPDVPVSGQTLIWGHSQGGQAALFAGQIAPAYAPELRVIGVVAGSPAAELGMLADEVARVTGRSVLTGLLVMIARAWSSAYPDLDAATVLTARGLRQMNLVEQRCIDGVLLAFAVRDVDAIIRSEGIRSPLWQAAIARNTPGAVRTAAPVRVFQGGADRLIRPEFTRALVDRLCAAGDTVEFQLYPGMGHLSVITPSMPETLAWMADRLAQRQPPSSC